MAGNQEVIQKGFDNNPFVAVFSLSTHGGRNTLEQDADAKMNAMLAGGATNIEILCRGDEHVPFADYMAATIAAIKKHAMENSDVTFAIGTIPDAYWAKQVAEMLASLPAKNGFMVTAHQDLAIVDVALQHGVSIFSTASGNKSLKFFKKDGTATDKIEEAYTVKPGEDTAEFDPAYIKALRERGVEFFKAFDAKAIGEKHAGIKVDPKTRTLHALVATAKAIIDSYGGENVPPNKRFYVMGTGGFDAQTIPVAIAGTRRQDDIREVLIEIAAPNAHEILDIIERMTFGTGGTFLGAEYDAAINAGVPQEKAAEALRARTESVAISAEIAKDGMIPWVKPEELLSNERKTLIFGEPLIQYSQDGDKAKEYVAPAGDNYNFAKVAGALAEAEIENLGKLYFGTAIGVDNQGNPTELDSQFIMNLVGADVDTDLFTTLDREHAIGSYTVHYDDGVIRKGDARNSYDRDNAAARFYFSKENVKELKRKVLENDITQVVGSLIMLGNCDDREAQLDFFRFCKDNGIEVIWADNYRSKVWGDDPKTAAKYSELAMKTATRAMVSFSDEATMHGDKNSFETAKRLHSYGVRDVVITNEDKAILVSSMVDGKLTQLEVMPAVLKSKEKHTAGAGDTFAAAYLHYIMGGDEPKEAAYNASLIAREVISKKEDNLEADDIPDSYPKPYQFESHPMVDASVRYFYRPDPVTGELKDADQEEMLRQIKAAHGVTAVTTSIHTKPREESFTAWEIVKLIRHVEFEKIDNDPIASYGTDEDGALAYLAWLKENGTRTEVYVMNFEDSRTADDVKYGREGRDKAIDIEIENQIVLSKCGLNDEERPGFCYTTNFMTPFDWFRTLMDYVLPDGTKAMAIRAELVCMFDRYVINIEPEKSGFYASHYSPDVMARAERLWKETFGETDTSFVQSADKERDIDSYTGGVQDFIKKMLKGHAGSSETNGYDLKSFRVAMKASRYLGQPLETACFENDPKGEIAHKQAQKNLAYYGNRLFEGLKHLGKKMVRFVFHPDDTAAVKNHRGDMGVFRVVSTAEDLLHMYESHIGNNACTGCFGSSPNVVCEADVIIEAVKLIEDKHGKVDLKYFMPFLHLRKVVRGDEPVTNYSDNPKIREFIAKIQKDLCYLPGSIAELPHHVALTPLFKTMQAMHDLGMLHVIRPDHTPTVPFYMDYETGGIVEKQLGQPGYDASRIMASQQIRIMADALHNLESASAREFVTHFENKLCSFGLDSPEGYRERMAYMRNLDFGRALAEFRIQNDFKPVFNKPDIADAIAQGNIIDFSIVELTEAQRQARLAA